MSTFISDIFPTEFRQPLFSLDDAGYLFVTDMLTLCQQNGEITAERKDLCQRMADAAKNNGEQLVSPALMVFVPGEVDKWRFA